MKHRDPYDLTEEEIALRRKWYTMAVECYELDHDQAEELAAVGAFAGGDSRRLLLDYQNTVKGLVEKFADTLVHPSGNNT